jgi:uncharacterized protein DUF222
MFGMISIMKVGVGGQVSGPELAKNLISLGQAVDLILLEFSRVAAEFAQTDEYDQQGYDSPISWIKENCHLPGGAAADRVCAGEQLERLTESTAALAEGRIGFAHFALLARTAEAVGTRFNETRLLKQAAQLSVMRFRNACMHARHAANPEDYVTEEKQGVEARSLTLTTVDNGLVLVNGILDKVGGAALRTALEPLAKRMGKHDDRLRDRRMADAIVDLSMHALDSGLLPQQGSQRTAMQVTTSLETLLGLCGAPAAEMEFSLPISAKAVERLACDCSVTRILLGSDSMVIDVGRARRTVRGPKRKALNARDKHCVWPGCDRPPTWTSAHHLVHWIHRGTDELSNLALLCYRHHWNVHEGNWQIVRTEDGFITVPPPTGFEQLPRGPARGAAA